MVERFKCNRTRLCIQTNCPYARKSEPAKTTALTEFAFEHETSFRLNSQSSAFRSIPFHSIFYLAYDVAIWEWRNHIWLKIRWSILSVRSDWENYMRFVRSWVSGNRLNFAHFRDSSEWPLSAEIWKIQSLSNKFAHIQTHTHTHTYNVKMLLRKCALFTENSQFEILEKISIHH